MTIQVDEIAEIAVDVWAALLSRELIPAALMDGKLSERAQVTIEGAWNGQVRVETSHALARQLTAHFRDLSEALNLRAGVGVERCARASRHWVAGSIAP